MPRKVKRSKKLIRSISNLKPHASSQGQSTLVDVPLQLSESAQPDAPTVTLTPLPIPVAQNLVSASDQQFNSMPHKMKRSNKRVRHDIPNLMSHASSQGHSAPMESPLQSSKLVQPSARTVTIIPPSIPTAQNLISPTNPSLQTLPAKGKISKMRVKFGKSNSLSLASSEGHSMPVESPLQPSGLAQPSAPTSTLVPPSIPVAQNPSSSLPPPSHMPRKAKYSNKRVRGITNSMPHVSSQGHSKPMDSQLKTSKEAQPSAPAITFILPTTPTTQNLVPSSDSLSSMPRKPKLSRERAALGISNLVLYASSQGHSTHVEPHLLSSQVVQHHAPTITPIPTTQNLVPTSVPPLHTRPRKARHSREKASPAITNFIPYASSQGHFTHVVPPLQPSQGAQHAPTLTVIPTTQSLVPTSDPPLRKMPRKTKHSRERASLGITSFMPYASSQGHSTPVEPPLQPSKVAQSSAPFLTHVPPSVPTAQNPVIPSGPPLPARPRKAKLSRERPSLGMTNFMSYASSQGHSTHLEPPLQPSLVAHSSAPTITHIPLSIATTQNLVSPSDPPLHKKSRKAKHSKKKVCHGLSNLMPHSSCQGHSTHVEPLLQPLELAQSRSPTSTHIPSSISAAPDPVSTSQPPSHMSHTNIFSGILKLMHHASYQGHTIPVESSQQPSTQHSAPTVTYIPPSIPTAEDLLSPSDLPSCLKPKSKHSKQRVSKGVSSLMPHATSEVHSKPLVPQLQLPEVAQHCAPIPPSIPIAEDSDSQSDDSEPSSSSMLHSEGHSIPLEPSLYPPEVAQHSAPIVTPIPPSIPIAEDSDSPSDDSDQSSHRTSDSGTFVPLSTHTRKILSNRSYGGRQWPVKAIDEHGRSQKIHVTKAGVFGMPPGQRIVVPFDRQLRAYGEAATLLSAACGHIVTNPKNVPINFNSWRKVPKSHKDHCFSILKTLFHFEASDSVARRYCLLTMSTKYRNGKMYLWTRMFDPSLSREQLIVKVPDGIPKDQWSSFVGYHLSPEYQELCRKNAEVRKKQTIPHTGGSKLLSRKQHEMEQELGRAVGRAELYIATHTRKDGSYINEEARSIGEKMIQEITRCANSSGISIDDAVARVLGQDHPGRVRCLGLGGLHSVAFESDERFTGFAYKFLRSDSAKNAQLKDDITQLRTKLVASEENVKTLQSLILTYIQMKEGRIPTELGALLDVNKAEEESSGEDETTPQSGSSLGSNRH